MKIGWFSALLLMLSHAAIAGTPQLSNLLPVAGQRGQTIEVNFYGERLQDVSSVLFHTKGITFDGLKANEKNNPGALPCHRGSSPRRYRRLGP